MKKSELTGLAEGQVLQRIGAKGATANLSGAAAATGPVLATISNKRGPLKGWRARPVGKAADGRFAATLAGIPAGGPYKLELSVGKKSVARIASFFVGDVWVLAGQSNMEGIAYIAGSAKPNPLVRAFSMRREWRLASEPLHLLVESPDTCHTPCQCTAEEGESLRRNAIKGSGVGLPFALEMLRRTGVPQGLLCVAHGGTSMNQWNPALAGDGGASLYGSMMLSLRATGQPVAGIFWYQGESDASPADAPLYEERMKNLVAATRRDFRQPGLPWVVVQISRVYGPGRKESDIKAWNQVQEIERLLPLKIKNLETVPAIDLPLDDAIHIGVEGFPRLALRAARAMSRLAHGNRRELPPPRLKSISKLKIRRGESSVLDVTFDNVVGGLRSCGPAHGFAILDSEGRDQGMIHKTTLLGDTARLDVCTTNTYGLQLSYGTGTMPICTITDGRDESLPVFGPIQLSEPAAFLPFMQKWKVTGILPATTPLQKIGLPDPDAHGAKVKEYPTHIIDEHPLWMEHREGGQVYYSARIDLPEPMKLVFLFGYDGPFRLWLDGKPFFMDLKGTNPMIMDEKRRPVSLAAGSHELRIAMDINRGLAWGFMFRFRRADVTVAQIKSGDYAKPSYSV